MCYINADFEAVGGKNKLHENSFFWKLHVTGLAKISDSLDRLYFLCVLLHRENKIGTQACQLAVPQLFFPI